MIGLNEILSTCKDLGLKENRASEFKTAQQILELEECEELFAVWLPKDGRVLVGDQIWFRGEFHTVKSIWGTGMIPFAKFIETDKELITIKQLINE